MASKLAYKPLRNSPVSCPIFQVRHVRSSCATWETMEPSKCGKETFDDWETMGDNPNIGFWKGQDQRNKWKLFIILFCAFSVGLPFVSLSSV